MWIYYNKLGELTTKIPHGEVVRQGATFNIYIALDPRIFEEDINSIPGENFNSYNLEALKQWVQQNIQAKIQILNVGVSTILNDQPTIQQFLKIKTSEITYDLIHGRYYLVYHYVGYHTLLTRCGNYTATFELENALNSTKKVLGNITFYAEKTLGNTGSNTVVNDIIPNVYLDGTEEELRSLQIDGEKFKISNGYNNDLKISETIASGPFKGGEFRLNKNLEYACVYMYEIKHNDYNCNATGFFVMPPSSKEDIYFALNMLEYNQNYPKVNICMANINSIDLDSIQIDANFTLYTDEQVWITLRKLPLTF